LVLMMVVGRTDVNRVNEISRMVPLHLAVSNRHASTVRLLLELGAKNANENRPGKRVL
jgi:ankyrin repeat protein